MQALERTERVEMGVVVRRLPGVTRWAAYSWKAVAVLPGAEPARWKVLREDGDAVEYHAATLTLTLHAAETEAYFHNFGSRTPSIFVVMRAVPGPHPLKVALVTASPYEAQDYTDNGEDLVERVPMPPALHRLIDAFLVRHHVEVPFVKRRRDSARTDISENGRGDARIRQAADVYRAPRKMVS